MGNQGAFRAPDLTDIGRARSAAALQRALLDPTGSMLPINRPVRAVTEDGRIAWCGPWSQLPAKWRGVARADHRPNLIVPGFVDCHIHFPQGQVVASYAGSLLEWLNTYTFVEEQKYADAAHAEVEPQHHHVLSRGGHA